MWHNTFAILALFIHYIIAVPTWPSSIDEIEDLMMLQSGYRSQGFASAVTPCTNGVANGFRTAAGFVRTAFHDIAAYDASAGTNGLDASIGFEMAAPFDQHNNGPDFYGAMSYYEQFFNSRASMADLIAVGVYASVRSCGGPIIALRAGRVDATGPGDNQLPDVQDSQATLKGRFAKMGFSTQEMIQLVACGHTLGGVHPAVNSAFNATNPNAAAEAAAQAPVQTFDTTDAQFDNNVAKEYVSGTSKSPLVVGPQALNSDLRVFSSDGNQTIRTLAGDNNVFRATCQNMFQKMIERVPSGVVLSDVIQPYDVKPGQLNLNIDQKGNLIFSGEIRIRTTNVAVSSVKLVYNDDSGAPCADCSIETTQAGAAQGFDENFAFYGFSAKVNSISSFNVAVTTRNGQIRMYNNGGAGFPVNGNAFVQVSSSSLSGSNLKVVVAMKGQSSQPEITLSTKSASQFNRLPTISRNSGTVSRICGGSTWSFYSATFNVDASAVKSGKLDVSVGGTIVDGFRSINFASSGIVPVCINAVSTTLSTSTTSSSSSTSSTTTSTSLASSRATTSSATTSSSTTQSSSLTTSSSATTIISPNRVTTSSGSSSTSTSSSSSFTTATSEDPSTTVTSLTTSNTASSSTSSGSTLSTTSSFSFLVDPASLSDGSTSSTTSSLSFLVDPASLSDDPTLSTTSSSSLVIDPASLSASSTTSTSDMSSSTSSKVSDTTQTSSTAISVPGWYNWDPVPSGNAPSSGQGGSSVPGKSTSTGSGTDSSGAYATPDVPQPKHDDAQAALASVYASLAAKPAPSGGTDGGNQNIAGLDMNVPVPDGKPTSVLTATTAVYTNTVVYVTTFANAQESANVFSGMGAAGSLGSGGVPTPGAGSSGASGSWGSGGKPASGAGSLGASESWGSWAPASTVKGASASASATKTGLIGTYTGGAESLRNGGLAVGMVAAIGAVAVML